MASIACVGGRAERSVTVERHCTRIIRWRVSVVGYIIARRGMQTCTELNCELSTSDIIFSCAVRGIVIASINRYQPSSMQSVIPAIPIPRVIISTCLSITCYPITLAVAATRKPEGSTRWSYMNWIGRPAMITTSWSQSLITDSRLGTSNTSAITIKIKYIQITIAIAIPLLTPCASWRSSTAAACRRPVPARRVRVLGRNDMTALAPSESAATTGPRPAVSCARHSRLQL